MNLSRAAVPIALGLALAGLAGLAPPSPSTARPTPPPIDRRAAELCARQLDYAAKLIAQNYFREIAEPNLIGAAALALYRAAQTQPPEELQRQPETYYAGRDSLEELTRLRQALGKADALRGGRDTVVGLSAMFELLDPHSVLIAPETLMADSVRAYVDVGLSFEDRTDPRQPWIIRGVAGGSPAEAAGLKPGDALLAIGDQEPPAPMLPLAFAQSLGAPAETRRSFTIRSPGEANPRRVTVVYRGGQVEELPLCGVRRLDEDSWDYWLDTRQKIAYIRCGYLTQDFTHYFAQTVVQLRRQGLAGLVLDLRDCQGGILRVTADVASMFLDEGQLIYRVRHGNANSTPEVLRGEGEPREVRAIAAALAPPEIKVAVLIGPDTMGGGELIAAALQDHRRAVIVGQRTRGKGTVQTTFNDLGLDNARQIGFRLSTGLLTRPSGQPLQRLSTSTPEDPWGVKPSEGYEVRVPAVFARQIRRWRFEYERRPADSRQVSPLDFPRNDPVLAAALRYFQTGVKPEL